MKIGINGAALTQKASIDAVREDAQNAASAGFSSYWIAEHPSMGFDALTVLASIARDVPDIELGTAVVTTLPRHPVTLAGQALTANDALGGRLCLGVGLSHAALMAPLGIAFDKPIRHLREFLGVLVPLLEEGRVSFQGETLRCDTQLLGAPRPGPPVVVAALGPQALRIAGSRTDGTTLAWTGPKTIREHIAPRISEAAQTAGRRAPRIIASLPVAVTEDAAAVRRFVGDTAAVYGKYPSYRAMFEREGVSGPGDLAIAGSANEVEDGIHALREAGVTDFAAAVVGTSRTERMDTYELLSRLNPAL